MMRGGTAAAGIAFNATGAAGSMHLMLTHLPNCFTIGERPMHHHGHAVLLH